MSKYIDTFADATVDVGSTTDTMTLTQAAVGIKKKVKIDPLLLQSIDVTTSLLLGKGLDMQNQGSEKGCVGSDANTCQPTNPGCKNCQ